MRDQQRVRSACVYTQSDQSLYSSLEYSVGFKLLTEFHLVLLSLKGGCTGSSEYTLVKMPHCWKSHVAAVHLSSYLNKDLSIRNFVHHFRDSGCRKHSESNDSMTTSASGHIRISFYDDFV